MQTKDNLILIVSTSVGIELNELRAGLVRHDRYSEPSRNHRLTLLSSLCEILCDKRQGVLCITHIPHIVVLVEVQLYLMVKHLTGILISSKEL